MPYEGEFAQYKPLRRIVESERVKSLLGNYRIRSQDEYEAPPLALHSVSELECSDWAPDWSLAIDGSHIEIPVENGYPGAEASYVTVASVLIDLGKIRKLDENRPVDPKEFRKLEQAESIDCALPGCNVVYNDEISAKDSLRRAVFEVLSSTRMSAKAESLLDTYEALLNYKPVSGHEQKCPYEDCLLPSGEYVRNVSYYQCQCQLARPLYSTDALRFHERMNPAGTNGAIFAEISQVLERIWMVHILRTLETFQWLSTLRRMVIVLDGPLAVFGQPAWISQAIYKELRRLNEVAKRFTHGQDILIIGIEKSGMFLDHLLQLDKDAAGHPGRFPESHVGLLSDAYIKQNIIFSNSTKPYGADTYFGRKFLYKTSSGALLVGSVPSFSDEQRDLATAEPYQFPRLADALMVLDQLVSSRYPNAVTPIVSAHAEASIPLHLGRKVLEQLARELMAAEE